MSIAQEVELKLELDPAHMAVLLADPDLTGSLMASREQHSVYFDTADEALRKAGLTLRVRHVGARRIQTIKGDARAAAGLFSRDERERDIGGNDPELDEEERDFLRRKLGDGIGPLLPLFTASVVRSSGIVAQGDASIELVADLGTVTAGDRSEPICEIEMELCAGEPTALFEMARALEARVPLRLGVRTKAERGYHAVAGKPSGAIKAEPVALATDMDAAALFQSIAAACIRHFRLNEDLILASGDAEAVHQARVALRRLRSAISIFRRMLPGPETDRLRGELKWIMGLLGTVRNLDVLIERLAEPGLRRRLRTARRRAVGQAAAGLESARFRRLMLDLAEWISVGRWLCEGDAAIRAQAAPEAAARLMDRLARKLRKAGKDLAHADDETRHKLRILAKKTRYATEFFADLFPGKAATRRRKHFLAAIEDLQAHLGDLNDDAVAAEVLEQAGLDSDLASLHLEAPHRDELLEKAEKAYHAITKTKVKPFWD